MFEIEHTIVFINGIRRGDNRCQCLGGKLFKCSYVLSRRPLNLKPQRLDDGSHWNVVWYKDNASFGCFVVLTFGLSGEYASTTTEGEGPNADRSVYSRYYVRSLLNLDEEALKNAWSKVRGLFYLLDYLDDTNRL